MDRMLDGLAWLVAAFLTVQASGCTPQERDFLKELAQTFQQIQKDKRPPEVATAIPSPTPTVTAIPTPSPTPEPTVHITPVVEPLPCGKRNPQDGHKRGFTWKPNSDTQKWATAVLPPGTHGPCTFAGLPARHKGEIGGIHEDGTLAREVHILDRWTGERLKKEHGKIIVRCDCWSWSIPDPSVRVD